MKEHKLHSHLRLPGWMLGFSVVILTIFLKAAHVPLIEDLQLKIFDTYQQIKPRPYQDAPVRIIDIDDASLAKLGQWPWPRNMLAELTENLHEAGATAVVFDIVFAEPDRTSPEIVLPSWGMQQSDVPFFLSLPHHDSEFANALAEANAVTGFVLTEENGALPKLPAGVAIAGPSPLPYLLEFNGAVAALPRLETVAAGNGALNSMPDRDGIIRKVPLLFNLRGEIYPSLSIEALRVAQGARSYIVKTVGGSGELGSAGEGAIVALKVGVLYMPTDAAGNFWVYFTQPSAKRYIPAWQIIKQPENLPNLEGHIALVGTTAAGLKDIRATPLSPAMAGVEVHAQAIEQMMHGIYLSRPDWALGAEILLMLVAGGTLLLVLAYTNALVGALAMLLILSGAIMFSWEMFDRGRLLLDPVTPSLAIIALYFIESLRKYVAVEKEKQHIRHAFSRYVSPVLAERLAAHPEQLSLGGENRELTVMFTDIRQFSSLSERMEPQTLIAFLNQFLTPMTDIILTHKGTVDKYMGDAIMAFWNAPLPDESHSEHAASAALAMLDAVKRFNRESHMAPIQIGIGMNTGMCCVGNMGSDQRFDYSALGHPVDMASRLEGQCKHYGVDVILGESTALLVAHLALLELDKIRVKGKEEITTIYTVLGPDAMKAAREFMRLEEAHIRMLDAYRAQQWNEAEQMLTQCRERLASLPERGLEQVYTLYQQRIDAFRHTPPGKDWHGVHIAQGK